MSQRSRWEIAAAIATGALHPVFVDLLHLKGVFIALVLGCWLCYLVRRARARPTVLAEWGFSGVNLKRSFTFTSVVAVAVLAVLAWVGSRKSGI